MDIFKRMALQQALIGKAIDERLTIEEYCHPNTDYIIVDENDEPSVYWGENASDFVVFGEYFEAKECAEKGINERAVKLVPWLKKHKIITSTYQLSKITR